MLNWHLCPVGCSRDTVITQTDRQTDKHRRVLLWFTRVSMEPPQCLDWGSVGFQCSVIKKGRKKNSQVGLIDGGGEGCYWHVYSTWNPSSSPALGGRWPWDMHPPIGPEAGHSPWIHQARNSIYCLFTQKAPGSSISPQRDQGPCLVIMCLLSSVDIGKILPNSFTWLYYERKIRDVVEGYCLCFGLVTHPSPHESSYWIFMFPTPIYWSYNHQWQSTSPLLLV